MRPVKSRHKAIERLAPMVPGVTPEDIGQGRYKLHVEGSDTEPAEKDSKHTLAFLAEEAKHGPVSQDEILEAVNWHGRVPTRGMSAWQEDALLWLQGSSIFGDG